jgi:hypothetical protein
MAGISNLHVGRLTAEDGRVRAVTDGIIADEAAHATPTNSGVVSAMDAGETVDQIAADVVASRCEGGGIAAADDDTMASRICTHGAK